MNGTADIGGTLTIILLDMPVNGTQSPIIDAEGITGSFADVIVQTPSTCASVSATLVVVNGGNLAALFEVTEQACKRNGLSRGAIAGITIGAVLGVTGLVILGLLILRWRHPSHSVFFFHEKDNYIIR